MFARHRVPTPDVCLAPRGQNSKKRVALVWSGPPVLLLLGLVFSGSLGCARATLRVAVVDPASQPVGNAGVRVDLKGKEVCRGHTSATGEFVCPERRYRRGSRLHVAVTAHRFHELDTQLKFSPTLTNIRLSIKPLFDLSQPAPEVRPGTEPLVGEVPLP